MKKRVVVVCPGRGSYTKETLGYLQRYGTHVGDFLADLDQRRRTLDQPTITTLDSAPVFKPAMHTPGENASTLIYACAYADFMAIDREKYEIVAVAGNSMGWYLTLAFGGALDWEGGFQVVNTMGSMMKNEIIGGQVIYPICDENWQIQADKVLVVNQVIEQINHREGHHAYVSIYLGGYIVIGANKTAVQTLLKELPPIENYPFQLINHAAFHTPLLVETSLQAQQLIDRELFFKPKLPLIDGRGAIWQPYSTDLDALYRYTLGHQVIAPYDFTKSISVALKEFAPDALILLGPGSSLGGSLGQILIANSWYDLKSKSNFIECQEQDPIVLAMGRPEQRSLVTK